MQLWKMFIPGFIHIIQLVFFILGIVQAFKRPKFKRLLPTDFTHVPTNEFEKWRSLELKSIDVYLLTTLALPVIYFVVIDSFCGAHVYVTLCERIIHISYGVLFLIGLIVSGLFGNRASKEKKSVGIAWPKKQ